LQQRLEIDTATYCKIEKGERRTKCEQVVIIAKLLNTDKDELLSLWLADQITVEVADEKKIAGKALKIAKQSINIKE
jgi:DNA-binding XRE family transcriptional regulator